MAKVNITEEENVVLFTGYNKTDIAQLGFDARNCAVLDSACSSTVCGENWLDNYINSLDKRDRVKVQQSIGQKIFKFGGGTKLKSQGEYSIPAVIAGKEVTIKTDVVGSDIPLLLSRTAMKTASVKMDLEKDTATIFGKDIALNLTSSGHYCIPIDRTEKIPIKEVFLVNLEEMNTDERYKTLLKLHWQFAHPPVKKLKALLLDAELWREDYKDLLDEINGKCDVCKRYAKTPPRPVVGLPMESEFNERVHSVTDMMLLKLEEENQKLDSHTLLCWANMARNSLQMWNGYSSHQLVFGRNPKLPGIMTDALPALEGITSSEIFAQHFNMLHKSRSAYIQTEADERIRRALRTKVRASEEVFEKGDTVYYKREGKERWLGPATVVFQDGKVVFVRQGGVFVRVSPNRLNKVHNTTHIQGNESKTNDNPDQFHDIEEKVKGPRNMESPVSEIISTQKEVQETGQQNANIPNINTEVDSDRDKQVKVKKNDTIKYKLNNEWVTGTITGRAGKAPGKNKTWYNIRDESNEERSIDLGRVEWEKLHETEINMAEVTKSLRAECNTATDVAKENELAKLEQFQTYEEVTDLGQRTLSTRWVISDKNAVTKARLVVRGFEENDIEIRRDSPTVGKGALRLLISIAVMEKWIVKTTDIKSAFLQGKEIERDVYIKPPRESKTPKGFIWKLKHGLYGLKDGARQFYDSVREELLKLGFIQCKLDPALFYLLTENGLSGIICCHVDDFLHAGDQYFEIHMNKLRTRFYAGKIEEKMFKYIGFTLKQFENGIVLDQSDYVNKMKNIIIDPVRASVKNEPLNEDEQTSYRQLIGQLNWAVHGSRPDMAFATIEMSTKLKQAKVCDLVGAVKKISRSKDIQSFLFFPRLNKAELKIVVYTDASLGNINGGTGSTGALIVWLMDNRGQCCPIAWNAHKIKRVVRSTLAAEMLSLQEGLETSFYYRQMLADILSIEPKTIKIEAYVDNKSVIEAISSTKMVDDKRLRVDVAAIQELLKLNNINKIEWIPGHLQLANSMTKQGASGYDLLKVLQSGKMYSQIK